MQTGKDFCVSEKCSSIITSNYLWIHVLDEMILQYGLRLKFQWKECESAKLNRKMNLHIDQYIETAWTKNTMLKITHLN